MMKILEELEEISVALLLCRCPLQKGEILLHAR
jgi:hypothetical protein